jgi:hypothetical protein
MRGTIVVLRGERERERERERKRYEGDYSGIKRQLQLVAVQEKRAYEGDYSGIKSEDLVAVGVARRDV